MNRTKIEWVKNPDGTPGYTWNPITGCLNHIDGKCKGGGFPCYAYKLAQGRLFSRYMSNTNYPSPRFSGVDAINVLDPFYPRFWEEKLAQPCYKTTRWGSRRRYTQKSKGIFVCDMSDLFGIGIPYDWTERVLHTIRECPQHRFYLLTKQPQNLAKFSPFPDNCWVGVTATDRWHTHNASKYLHDIGAKVKYLSFEPLLGWGVDPVSLQSDLYSSLTYAGIKWVIIGSQTKPNIYAKEEWIKEIEDACDKANIPVFEKTNLRKVWYNSPRQEIPEV